MTDLLCIAGGCFLAWMGFNIFVTISGIDSKEHGFDSLIGSALGLLIVLGVVALVVYFIAPSESNVSGGRRSSTVERTAVRPKSTPDISRSTLEPNSTLRASTVPIDQPKLAAPTQIHSGCPGGCMVYPTWCAPPIKGNVGYETQERIYHVPGQEFYEETVINTRFGERWFCTEEEATSAGWRKARR